MHDLSVASDPAIQLAPLRYKYLGIICSRDLFWNNGNYNSYVTLDSHVQDLINWWITNIDVQVKSLWFCPHNLELYSDACLTVLGPILGDI